MTARDRRLGLQLKIVVGLLVIAAVPLLVSAVLIDQIAVVAQNFASNEAARLRPSLEKAQEAYRELVAARKATYRQAGGRIAAGLRPLPVWTEPSLDKARVETRLAELLDAEVDLQSAQVRSGNSVVAMVISAALPGGATGRWRDLTVSEPLPGGYALDMTFVTRVDFLEELRALGPVLEEAERAATVRASLPSSYRAAFLLVVGGVVLIVTTAGILLARRLTKRIERLAAATTRVTAGDLAVRVDLPGRDEIGALSQAFNQMVEQLARGRQEIAYLQKMSAWQDVARRLAHEIKNPLTPIQLAVQQLASSYRGDDPRYRKTLAEATAIVEEEIGGLRRLVDAFRSLGRLPRAKPELIDLAVVVGDVARDPELGAELTIAPPAEAVVIPADRLLLKRVLANLIENGVHAGQDAGRAGAVRVSWWREPGRAVIAVDDEGRGVPDERRETIFEPYVTTKERGTGLGLAIAKKIALEHGGSLELSPAPAPTGGARFLVVLPQASA
jgi:nitrogen fixation/metabolism regulation signal transduction histidine kinase